MADKEKDPSAGGFIDILTMWGIVPAALIAGSETGALTMLGNLIKKFYDQGKEVYESNMRAFKVGSIKTTRIVHHVLTVSLVFLAVLLATLLLTDVLADNATAMAGIIVFLVFAIGNYLYVTFVVPPVPEFKKKTGNPDQDGDKEFDDEGIELHPDMRKNDAGEDVPNEIAGKRVLADPENVHLNRVSVLATMVILAVCGYLVTAMLYMIAGFGESRIPAIIGTIVLVLTSAGLRFIVAVIAKAIKLTGMFVESAAGTLRLHTLALMAGHTYKDLDKGPMELFNEGWFGTASIRIITSIEGALLILGFFVMAYPSGFMVSVIWTLIMIAWIVMLLLGKYGMSNLATKMTEATVLFIANRGRIVASISVIVGAVIQVFVLCIPKEKAVLASKLSNDASSSFYDAILGFFGLILHPFDTSCRYFINTTDLGINVVVLALACGAFYGLVKLVLGIHTQRKKEDDDDKYRKTEIGILVLAGLNVIVVGFALVSTFAAVKVDSEICGNNTKSSSTAQTEPSKEVAKPLASAQPTSVPAEQKVVNEDSPKTDSAKPAETEVRPLTALEQEQLNIKQTVVGVSKTVLSQTVPARAPQVRAPSPTPPSAPATGAVASKSSLDDEEFDRIAKRRGW